MQEYCLPQNSLLPNDLYTNILKIVMRLKQTFQNKAFLKVHRKNLALTAEVFLCCLLMLSSLC